MATSDTSDRDKAAQELREASNVAPGSIDMALGANFNGWLDHIKNTATLPAEGDENDGTLQVPLMVYGDGPHDYISTDIDAGQVIVRDGNDESGKAWKFPADAFQVFVARAQGREDLIPEDEKAKGDNPIEAAAKWAKRTAEKVEADQEAGEEASQSGAANVQKVDRAGGTKPGTKS